MQDTRKLKLGPLKILRVSWRDLAASLLPILLLIAVSIWIAFHFVRPAPPDVITIVSGPEGSTLWRYAELLPCDPKYKVDLGTGYTPLLKAERLGKAIGLDNLWIKNDTVNPTWSFKDRVVSVAIARAPRASACVCQFGSAFTGS